MRGCGCGCFIGILLILVAVAALMLVVVLPAVMDVKDVPTLNNALQRVLCQSGETLSTERHVGPSYDGGTSYSATYYCTNNDEVERDVTGAATLMGMVIFVIPFLIGLFMIIGSSFGMAGRAVTTTIGSATSTILTMSADNKRKQSVSMGGEKDSISDRLRDLKSAYDQGLITEAEYELKRKEILRQM